MPINTCFACDIRTSQCVIFEKPCPYDSEKDCEYYYSKRRSFPDGFKSYMEIVNMMAQIRADKSQRLFNKYIIILTTVAIAISVISLVISLLK